MTTLVGVDAGGTSTRAVACDEHGEVLGRGRAAGANVRSAVGNPATNVASALRDCLAGSAAGPPDALCVGIAGTEARRAEVEALVRRAARAAGIGAAPIVVPDLQIAYRSAARRPKGRLLLAGTGAVAVPFAGWEPIARRDGLGWLLGDAGSGVWIGRRVLRAVAADLDGGRPTALTTPVLDLLDIPAVASRPADGQDLVRATDGVPPAAWGRFAPVALARAGDDEVAADIVAEAARALLRTVGELAGGTADAGPVVLAGGLLSAGPLREAVAAGVEVAGFAAHPVAGACVAAADSLDLDLRPPRL
ncbi:N-acetylglucosamine kinase [Agilicoccus flavus]|uniref:N-acetylglucosamine kinase n=1 Tax=Agilicoccus flavus TaxID=2775968 RepID=UPI001CF6D9FB|nr:BadF/BadG/BcrA/BcrD ATPase family protein [Agilicoccus flavus]